jgi:translocation and assembly module TamB
MASERNDQAAAPAASSASPQPGPSRRRRHPILLAIAGLLLVLLAAIAWLAATESGTRALLRAAQSFAGESLQVRGVSGRLTGPLRIEELVINQPDSRTVLRDLRLDWRPSELLRRNLHITSLHVARADITSTGEPKEEEKTTPPGNIGLPFKLQLDEAKLDQGSFSKGPAKLADFGPIGMNAEFDGERYRLRLRELAASPVLEKGSASTRLSGEAEIAALPPHALSAAIRADAKGTLQDQNIGADGKLNLSGSLQELTAKIDLVVNQAPIQGQALLRPFSEKPLGPTRLTARGVDLSRLMPDLPETTLDAELVSSENGDGRLSVNNRSPGTYDRKKVPLLGLDGVFRQDGGSILIDHIVARLGDGKTAAGDITGNAVIAGSDMSATLHTERLNLQALDGRSRPTSLSGKVGLKQAAGRQEASVDLSEPLGKQRLRLEAHAAMENQRITVDRARLQAGSGIVSLTGQADLAGDQAFRAEGNIERFRLQDLGEFAQLPGLLLNARFNAEGRRQPGLAANLEFSINDSRLAGNPLAGNGKVKLDNDRLDVPAFLLTSGANRLTAEGSLAEQNAQIKFNLDAPRLAQLGPAFSGAARAAGTVRGSLQKPAINAEWSGSNLRLPGSVQIGALQGKADAVLDREKPLILNAMTADVGARGLQQGANKLADLELRARFAPAPDAPLSVSLRANGIQAAQLKVDRINVSADGTTARHAIEAALNEPAQNWTLRANGGLSRLESAPQWQGSIASFNTAGKLKAGLAAPAPLLLSAAKVQLDNFIVDTDGGRIGIEQFLREDTLIATRGRLEKVQIAQWLRLLPKSPPLRTDLQFSGDWNLRMADTLSGNARLQRDSGDATVLGSTPLTLGLRRLSAALSAESGRVDVQLQAEGSRLGTIDVAAGTRTGSGSQRLSLADDAPLSGRARIDVPSLSWLGPLASPSLAVAGRLQSDVAIAGSVGDPRLAGSITGDGLRVAMADLGVDLRDGSLRSEFQGERLVIESLNFRGGGGSIALSGPIDLGGGEVAANIALHAERFAVLNRPDRRVIVSGDSQLAYAANRATVNGAFTVDSGFVDLGSADKPELSSDVVIVGQEKKGAQKTAASVDVSVSLGEGVALKGRGIDATLVGKVRIISAAGETLRAQGTLSIAKGTFSAYGRELAIEQGEIRFTGPLDNPALDILAMRRGQEVEAGVSVRGTVLAPRITLVSEPSVADAEKLSWLVLGRGLATASQGDATTLQSAAAALLARGAQAGVQSRIASAFGLDTFSVGTSNDNLQQRIVTLGKQISSRLYLSYQQGLENAGSVVQLRYALSPKLSVEAEAGARSALSLFYNIAFD